MTVSSFITILRLAVGDIGILTQNKFSGDGSTTAFRTKNRPILDTAYQVYIYSGGVWSQQTETTHYTIDKDSGIITFITAPSSGASSGATNDKNVRIDYKYAFMRDDEYLQIIANILRMWKRKLFAVATDETTFNSVVGADEYDLDTISTAIFWVIQVEYKTANESNWHALAHSGCNWTYEPTLNKVIVKPSFQSTSHDLRFMYVTAITVPTATTETFALDEDFHPPVIKKGMAEYWKRFASYKLKDTGAISKENSYHPAVEIMRMAREMDADANVELGLVKPRYPVQAIQKLGEGKGR